MEKLSYLKHIEKVFSNNFNMEFNKTLMNKKLDIYGVWNMKFGRTFISKNKVIDQYECNEHCLVIDEDKVDEKNLDDFINYLKECAINLVKPNRYHKTTYITGILIANEISNKDLIKKIKRFNYIKNYRMSFYGWCILRLVVVDFHNRKIYCNKISKDIASNLTFDKVSTI